MKKRIFPYSPLLAVLLLLFGCNDVNLTAHENDALEKFNDVSKVCDNDIFLRQSFKGGSHINNYRNYQHVISETTTASDKANGISTVEIHMTYEIKRQMAFSPSKWDKWREASVNGATALVEFDSGGIRGIWLSVVGGNWSPLIPVGMTCDQLYAYSSK